MSIKNCFFVVIVSLIIPFWVTGQVTDSTKIKYDSFVNDKKLNAKDKYTYSQFAIALRYKDSLVLSSLQVDRMYEEIKFLKQTKNDHYQMYKESKDTRSYESQKMMEILTASQYNLLLRLKNHKKAKSMTENDWREMELRQMDTHYSKEEVQNELYEYYIIRESLYDKFRHDPIMQSEETRAHYLERPACLKALTKLRRTNSDVLGNNLNGN